jgi:hypothetical protein
MKIHEKRSDFKNRLPGSLSWVVSVNLFKIYEGPSIRCHLYSYYVRLIFSDCLPGFFGRKEQTG